MLRAERLMAIRALIRTTDAEAFFYAAKCFASEGLGVPDGAAFVAALNECGEFEAFGVGVGSFLGRGLHVVRLYSQDITDPSVDQDKKQLSRTIF